jgi:radical SAM protein with 4Fe4S-binding SPASM domain
MNINDSTVLCAPSNVIESVDGMALVVDPTAPNWIATDERGLRILRHFDGHTTFRDVVRDYAAEQELDLGRAWLHVETFARDALRQKFLLPDGVVSLPYLGRTAYLKTDRLNEFWIQVNDFCNLCCEHCLVSSSPKGGQGLPGDVVRDAIDQAVALGVKRFFLTGGEPLARPDALNLIAHIVNKHERELVLLTNGTLFSGERLAQFRQLPRKQVRVQISLDGASATTNDPIRGPGSFDRICKGIRAVVAEEFKTTITMVLLRHNLHDAAKLVALASELGVKNVHLLWPHRRGRVLTGAFADLPAAVDILEVVREAREVARGKGVTIDNVEELRLRFDGLRGVKNDLAAAGWTSLCLYTNGSIYPSASMAGAPGLECGNLLEKSLEAVWKESDVLQRLRKTTVEEKTQCRTCHLKFLCGGGDFEHGYWASSGTAERSSFAGHDPYCELYQGLASDTFGDLAGEGRSSVQARSGFDRPIVFRGMGERTLSKETDIVRTTHSACVLSEEVADRSRAEVREFYGYAAEQPQSELCCPVPQDAEDLEHIPPEVVERFYGCGSPVSAAAPQQGEVLVDLGSGAGIDCFIASRRVGQAGRVVGVDMTDQMLDVSREHQPKVAAALGYDNVVFRKGLLERIPVDEAETDIVTSNCVINLSPDKSLVFREIWRVLRDNGRAVISDIVSDDEVPQAMRADGHLWGECISGSLSEEALLATMERAGFYGISVLRKFFWREVNGARFYSVTVRGYKFRKQAGCSYVGQRATYLGPMKSVLDEEGHTFPRGVSVEVCTDTAAKLRTAPYTGSFVVTEGKRLADDFTVVQDTACDPESGCC